MSKENVFKKYRNKNKRFKGTVIHYSSSWDRGILIDDENGLEFDFSSYSFLVKKYDRSRTMKKHLKFLKDNWKLLINEKIKCSFQVDSYHSYDYKNKQKIKVYYVRKLSIKTNKENYLKENKINQINKGV